MLQIVRITFKNVSVEEYDKLYLYDRVKDEEIANFKNGTRMCHTSANAVTLKFITDFMNDVAYNGFAFYFELVGKHRLEI